MFIWQDHIKDGPMGAMTATAHAKKSSEQPVYDLLFIWHDDCRPVTKTQRLRPLIPGEEDIRDEEIPAGSDLNEFGVVAIFRDHAGIRWYARPDGRCEELPPGGEPPHS